MRIAVVGSGVSGLVVAHLLQREHEVTVFEASDRIGGHTHTHSVSDGRQDLRVDSGFIVFNEHNYPLFTKLLSQLGVDSQASDMGFSVRDDRDGTEYSGRSLRHLYAQPSNLLRLDYHRMLFDLLRFYREAPQLLKQDSNETLGSYLERHRYGRRFVEQHILPMGAALWSCGEEQMLEFPARFFVEFLHNHRMLQLRGRPQWRVVRGGSSQYLSPLSQSFRERVRLNTPVLGIERTEEDVRVRTAARVESFDQLVLACHSDQSLRMLDDPSPRERQILGTMPYSKNPTLLHTDTSVLPRRTRLWSSWNYHVRPTGRRSPAAAVTYHMNTLQGLRSTHDFCVSLNQGTQIDSAKVLREMDYEHPQYTVEGLGNRSRWSEISGHRRTHYCGAYWGWGFHEDGVRSAVRVGRYFGQEL